MYDRILTEARSTIWLIRPEKLDAILDMLEARASGIQADGATLAVFAADNAKRSATRQQKAVGVLPIYGSIVQRGNMFTEASGTASCTSISQQFKALQNNQAVSTIVLDIDSPGGTVSGVPELADEIQRARGGKPIIAAINAEACSAAYWLASAADEIVITPSGCTGSIGAYTAHVDQSKFNEQMGVKRTYISYGKYKTESNPDQPLSDETAQELQRRVDHYGRMFEAAIAANRGVSVEHAKENWGQGRVLNPEQAKAVGMVDRIEPFEATLDRVITADSRRIKRRMAHLKRFLELPR